MDNTEFTPGTYTVKTTVTAGDQKWRASPTFTIDREEAKHYNDSDVSIEEKTTPPWIWVGIAVILILIAVVIFMYSRNRRLKKKLDGK
jgi:uncharacterized membrane protein